MYLVETISESPLILDDAIREKALKSQNSKQWIKLDSISIEEFVNLLPIQNYSPKTTYLITTTGNANQNWIQEEEIDYLMKYLHSEQPSHCVMQAISSNLPIGKTSTVGGQIQNLLVSHINNKQYPNGLTICESSDEKRIEVIEKLIKNKKN